MPLKISKIFQRSFQFVNEFYPVSNQPTIFLITNVALQNNSILKQIITNSSDVICADGGANHFFNLILQNPQIKFPKIIIGDLDSISEIARDFFKSKNTEIILDDNQSENDFHKALALIDERYLKTNEQGIRLICTNDFSRFDHFLFIEKCQFELCFVSICEKSKQTKLRGLFRWKRSQNDSTGNWHHTYFSC